ncbi:MAG: RNA polymerase sigma factor [Clostridiales bacterium]|nr:RNA polymerase sigma factor [Clostridiales bacterium]
MGITVDEDSLLVQKMRMGDEKAFDKFITKYYPAILRYCQIHIKDYGYAEDMTQETFTRFFRTFRQYKHYGKAVNYLYVIASNVCNDYYRKKKEFLPGELPETTDKNISDIDNKIVISEALDMLPKELKEVAVMFFVQELKQKDIALILEIGIPLVKYRIRKAKEQLAQYFGKEYL